MSPDLPHIWYWDTVSNAIRSAQRWKASSHKAALEFAERIERSHLAIKRSRDILNRADMTLRAIKITKTEAPR
jgi:hypothetical protein